MPTMRDLSSPKQITADIDVVNPRLEFLINPNDGTLCVIKGLIPSSFGGFLSVLPLSRLPRHNPNGTKIRGVCAIQQES